MKQNVILDIGMAFKPNIFENLVDESIYNILYIGEYDFVKQLKEKVSSKNIQYFLYDEIYSFDENNLDGNINHDLVDIIDYVMNDRNTIDLYDRVLAPYIFNYATKSEVKIISMIVSAYKYLNVYNPSFLLYYECPHNINSWVIAKVAEFLKIPVKYCRNHVFMWRNVLLQGMNKNPLILNTKTVDDPIQPGELVLFEDIVNRYNKGVESIKPEFLEVQKKAKRKKIYSFYSDIKENWRKPYVSLYKSLCYKSYKKVSQFTVIPEKFIVFYLHLQPERTTLPEGYGFTQQYKAISILNELIPHDWKILVKEHPATFYRYCVPVGRWPSFYNYLNNLSKVSLVPLETDPYLLIQQSKCVCTITGTIAREALMMGKPVISFGLSTLYKSYPLGMHNYKNYNTLKQFIGNMETYDPKNIIESFKEIVISEVLCTGSIGLSDISKWNNAGETLYKSNEISRFKLLKFALSAHE